MKNNKDSIILGIESSCDDTSAAVLINGKIYSNVVANQEVHTNYGGVVPELASRAHQQNIVPVVDQALKKAKITTKDLSAIAFTKGPGLLGSLLVGTSFAKSMGLGLNIPIIDVHHMKAHIHAHFIQTFNKKEKKIPEFPFICLTVSGGHTQIVLIKDYLDMTIVGETIDDAAGEAFDKAAKLLGFDYPGGPLIDQYSKKGDVSKFKFTYPKVNGYNYSFSGLKTQFLYFLEKNKNKDSRFIQNNLADICASYQNHIISYLFKNVKKAMNQTGCKDLAIAGGVAANSALRKQLKELGQEKSYNTFIPEFEYCTDNAAMIAISGYFLYNAGQFAQQNISPTARITF